MTDDELSSLTIASAGRLLRTRALSPVELTEAYLARIARLDPTLRAFITVTGDLARQQARRAERELARRQRRGPLHGIPFTLKDLYWTAGVRTTAGSRILARWAGLAAGVEAAPELAANFQAFHERVERLYAIDVETVEFDFLRPMD